MAALRPAFVCSACARSLRMARKSSHTRHAALSTATSGNANAVSKASRKAPPPPPATAGAVAQAEALSVPRWSRTPARMKMPIRVRPMPDQSAWSINEDQEVLDKVLDDTIGNAGGEGERGRDILPDEVKWLAVTHKTFEQGARGFNDRLALLGKRILDIQTSKSLLTSPLGPTASEPSEQIQGEEILGPTQKHPDLAGVENITAFHKQNVLLPQRVARLAERYGIDKVARWVPRHTDAPERSGRDIVLANTLYAIIGAVALRKGGEVANVVARERILKPLGL